MLEAPKKAVPVGTAAGVQFAALLKLPLVAGLFQVAFCASTGAAAATDAADASNSARTVRAVEDLCDLTSTRAGARMSRTASSQTVVTAPARTVVPGPVAARVSRIPAMCFMTPAPLPCCGAV